jgi:hypothetical protein
MTLGEVRSKYGEIQAPTGSVKINGDAIKAEGVKELEDCTNDLIRLAPEIPFLRD